jgi:hypothetical protein
LFIGESSFKVGDSLTGSLEPRFLTLAATLREIAVRRMLDEPTESLELKLARSQRVRLDEIEATTEHFFKTADE